MWLRYKQIHAELRQVELLGRRLERAWPGLLLLEPSTVLWLVLTAAG